MLAKNWAGSDPAGWWMSEKLDGIRALWDGSTLTTRASHPISAPSWFVEALPAGVCLDGELWIGRRDFQKVTSVYRTPDNPEWVRVRYAVFDAPAMPGGFEDRQRALRALIHGNGGPVFVLDQRRCDGREDLHAALAAVVRAGGEGLMLREPGSLYEPKRSSTLLKVKTAHDDEATVIGYEPGTGRNSLTIGALIARLTDGTVFNISSGLADAIRHNPPPIGSVVTFRHHGYTDAGVPRFPSFLRRP